MYDLIIIFGCGGTGRSIFLNEIKAIDCHLSHNLSNRVIDKEDTIIIDTFPKTSIDFVSVYMNSPFDLFEQIESNHSYLFCRAFSLLFAEENDENKFTYITFFHSTSFAFFQIPIIIKKRIFHNKICSIKMDCNQIIKPLFRRRC